MTLSLFLADYGASLAACALFALLHSVGAQEPCKDALARVAGRFFVDHFWRILYCALSFWALYYGVASLHWAANSLSSAWFPHRACHSRYCRRPNNPDALSRQ